MPPELVAKIPELAEIQQGAVAIIVSHDCDVSSEDFGRDPHAEVLIATPAGEPDGNLRYGKNPRQIQVTISERGRDHLFQAQVDDRQRIDRRILATASPDPNRTIADEDRDVLPRWLAKRYSRAAFPDAFNMRVRTATDKIRRRLRKGGINVTGIWMGLHTSEELPDGHDYDIQVWFVMRTEDFDDEDTRLEAQACAQDVAALLDGCNGLSVVHDELIPEIEMSMESLRELDRWDCDDDLTVREVSAADPVTGSDF